MLRTRARIAALAAIAALTVAISAPALAGTSGSVTVEATVNSSASVSVVSDNQVIVYANAPWMLSCETDSGIIVIDGSGSTGTVIELPAGTTAYSVSLD